MQKTYDVVCVGVMVADILAPNVDKTVFDREMTRVPLKFSPGGDAFNQAINLSAMGYAISLCGKVGADSIGNFLISEAKTHNIDTSLITIDSEHQTSATIVLINENGERNFIGTENGTNGFLTSQDMNLNVFQSARIVSIGSLYGSVSFKGEEVAKVLEAAKYANCITVVDMMHADRNSLEDASKCLKFVDYFIPNLKEAQCLTGKNNVEEISEVLLHTGVKCVVIKMGDKGCFIKSKGMNIDSQYIQAYASSTVVDTTGAGDAFVSGFISGIIDGLSPQEASKRGCAAGFLAISKVGATGAIERKSQILEITKI